MMVPPYMPQPIRPQTRRVRYSGNHRIGNTVEFDKRWRHNRVRNRLARISRRKNCR